MRAATKIILFNDQNEKFFGEGPYQLLKAVEENGSLHAAANQMGMAYSKATMLLKNAEKSLGFSLTVRKIGGKSGGGSILTKEAEDFMRRFELYRNACIDYNQKLFNQYFNLDYSMSGKKVGCIIMASGLGKRFGGDKLMTMLYDKPMLQYIIDTTDELFFKRIVVTRNENVKKWCEEKNIPVIFHEEPNRNDTIRLGLEAFEQYALDGCVFCPADMPFVSKFTLNEMLCLANEPGNDHQIIRVSYDDKVGAPVYFGSIFFEQLKSLPNGKGGSVVIKDNSDKLCFVNAKHEHELWDIDTKEDYEIAKNKMKEINFSI